MLWNFTGGGIVEAALFVIILLALLVQPRHGGREEEKGSWASVQPWAPLEDALRKVWADSQPRLDHGRSRCRPRRDPRTRA